MSEPWKAVPAAVEAAVTPLQAGYLSRAPWAIRLMAQLRHAELTEPGTDPQLWEVTLGRLPEDLLGHGSGPATASERAVHASLVLYSLHQQSRTEPMHHRGVGLGRAVRTLSSRRSSDPQSPDPGTISRFQHLCRAATWSQQLQSLRGLVQLMRAEGIPVDHARLAGDLWALQTNRHDSTILSWGRQFQLIGTTSEGDLS